MKDRQENSRQDFIINKPPDDRWTSTDRAIRPFRGNPLNTDTVSRTYAFRHGLISGKPAGDATPPPRRPGIRKS